MPADWVELADAVLNVLGVVREAKVRRDEQADRALMAIYTAANETRKYLSAIRNGKARDLAREHDLANLWHMASIPIRHFDRNLANRCMLKGNYWLAPDAWTVADINTARIGLERVFKEAQYLLYL